MKLAEQVGTLWSWWEGDYFPELITALEVVSRPIVDATEAAEISHLSTQEAQARLDTGNKLYAALLEKEVVGYGWCATKQAVFGKPQREIIVPEDNMYLWDFATYPDHRGKSVYPQLLQQVIKAELGSASKFWALNAIFNTSSVHGIEKTGLTRTGLIRLTHRNEMVVAGVEGKEKRAREGAALLGLKLYRG